MLKKLFSLFLIISFVGLNSICLASDIKIKKQNGKYGAIDNETNEVIIPFEYYKIEKFDTKDPIFYCYINKDKVRIISPKNKDDFIKNLIENNNKISWIKFYDYPNGNTVITKHKRQYGYITQDNDDYIIQLPIYNRIFIPDSNSAIFKQLGITFSPLQNIKFQDIKALYSNVYEDVELKNDEIIFRYKKIENYKNYYLAYKNSPSDYVTVYLMDNKDNVVLEKNIKREYSKKTGFNSLDEILKENNQKEFVKFYNYPKNAIYLTYNYYKPELIIFNGKNKKIIKGYEDFSFFDEASAIFRLLNLSYSNQKHILAKKDKKWGIIDDDNNVIVDFKYDEMIRLNAKENVDISYDKDNINIKYKNYDFKNENLILARENDLWGVIDYNGKILIPFKERFSKEKLQNYLSENNSIYQTSENETLRADKIKEKEKERKNFKENARVTLVTFPIMLSAGPILLPLMIYSVVEHGRHPYLESFFNWVFGEF